MPRQPKIRIEKFQTEDECDAYIEAVGIYLKRFSASRRGRLINPVTINIQAGFIKSAFKRKKEIRANSRATEIAACRDPNDEPATTVFVGQDGTVGISK